MLRPTLPLPLRRRCRTYAARRRHYIAAEEELWDYAPQGGNMCGGAKAAWTPDEAVFTEPTPFRPGSKCACRWSVCLPVAASCGKRRGSWVAPGRGHTCAAGGRRGCGRCQLAAMPCPPSLDAGSSRLALWSTLTTASPQSSPGGEEGAPHEPLLESTAFEAWGGGGRSCFSAARAGGLPLLASLTAGPLSHPLSLYTDNPPCSSEEGYLGMLGPILRAEVGDTLEVLFKNKARFPSE